MSQQWKAICNVADIPVLGARVVKRAAKPDVAIFRNSQDKVFALLDRCPHKGGPLSQGIVFGERVACPLHNWNIKLDSGCAVEPDEGCTQKFSIKVEDAENRKALYERLLFSLDGEPDPWHEKAKAQVDERQFEPLNV
jgi:nitrite reductase (NADH) small subunit